MTRAPRHLTSRLSGAKRKAALDTKKLHDCHGSKQLWQIRSDMRQGDLEKRAQAQRQARYGSEALILPCESLMHV